MKKFSIIILTAFAAVSCIKSHTEPEEFKSLSDGVFISCEGGLGSANASLSYYDPETKTVENNVFYRANSARFGDTAQSLLLDDEELYAVINNSGVVYRIDPETFVVKSRLEGLLSPRYAITVSDTKGYISTMNPMKADFTFSYDSCDIKVFDPQNMTVTKTIAVENTASTEQMILVGDKLFVECWTNGKSVAVIDTKSDKVEKSIEVGIQPCSMVSAGGAIWVVCDGGSSWCPIGNENPSLWRVDVSTLTAKKVSDITRASEYESLRLAADGDGSTLYLMNGNIFTVNTENGNLTKIITMENSSNYAIAADPYNGDIYLADAVDYKSNGKVWRYNSKGELIDSFSVGISPSSFAFK